MSDRDRTGTRIDRVTIAGIVTDEAERCIARAERRVGQALRAIAEAEANGDDTQGRAWRPGADYRTGALTMHQGTLYEAVRATADDAPNASKDWRPLRDRFVTATGKAEPQVVREPSPSERKAATDAWRRSIRARHGGLNPDRPTTRAERRLMAIERRRFRMTHGYGPTKAQPEGDDVR